MTATIYARLMDERTDKPRRDLENQLAGLQAESTRKLSEWTADQLRKAYTAGVVDGYAQGVAAEPLKPGEPDG